MMKLEELKKIKKKASDAVESTNEWKVFKVADECKTYKNARDALRAEERRKNE